MRKFLIINQESQISNPRVSVIIPTYNRASLLIEAIQSVLDQTYKDFEIIVVDDGSTDNTREVLFPFKNEIIYLYQENRGGAAARNKGIEHAKGRYISFLDSDDLWFPHKLEKQVVILDNFEDIDLVYTNILVVRENSCHARVGFGRSQFAAGSLFREVLLWKVACGYLQTWLVRKRCFEEVGYFDEELAMAHDRDMIVRLAEKYKIYGIKEPLVKIRQHESSQRIRSISAKKKEYYWFKFLDKLFSETEERLIDKSLKRRLIAHYYFLVGKQYLIDMDHGKAAEKFRLSILNYPYKLKNYLYLLLTIWGRKGYNFFYKIRKIMMLPLYFWRRLRYQKFQKKDSKSKS